MKKGIYILPNSITLCGMFAGFYAIIAVLNGDYVVASWAILAAGVFDGLDGWVARLTQSNTRFGIELDSLSDVIAFGVAPSALLYRWALSPFGRVGWAAVFLFLACGAMRLARYNIQMGSTERKFFTGMPIPGAAAFVATTVIFYNEMGWAADRSFLILFITLILSIFMVTTLRFHSLKEIDLKKRKPFWALVGIVVIFVVVAMQPEVALFVFALLYTLEAIAENAYLFLKEGKAGKKELPPAP
jgi:CDP-diacylglycerol--serine O-phosphatidyltransferase